MVYIPWEPAELSLYVVFQVNNVIFSVKIFIPPAEQNLTDKPMLFKLLQEVKTKQFDLQKSFLKAQLEKIMDCAVENIELSEKK